MTLPKKKKVRAWGVTNLGGENLVWGSYKEQRARLPVFLNKGSAVEEKSRLDFEKPSPNPSLFERRVVRVILTFSLPTPPRKKLK